MYVTVDLRPWTCGLSVRATASIMETAYDYQLCRSVTNSFLEGDFAKVADYLECGQVGYDLFISALKRGPARTAL